MKALLMSLSSMLTIVSSLKGRIPRGHNITPSFKRSMTAISNVRTALDEASPSGEFQRRDATWRNWIRKDDPQAEFPPQSNRYLLYVAYACPWAHRTLITRALKGLEEAIDVVVVHPTWQRTRPDQDEHIGWVFGNENSKPFPNADGHGGPFAPTMVDCKPDPIFDAKSIRAIYEAVKDTDGKYTVPVLFDTKTKTIVSNESADIIRMLNSEFNSIAENPELDLYPADMREAIDKVNDWVYPALNNGVYRCGFAQTQEAYNKAIDELTKSFDEVEKILQQQRYIAGDRFTEADIRLFVTLIRFDEVYTVYFKTNTRYIMFSEAILNYCREIYQMPGVKETVNMEHIKQHYYTSHPRLNYFSIIPRGPDFLKLMQEPHNRDSVGAVDETLTVNSKRQKVN